MEDAECTFLGNRGVAHILQHHQFVSFKQLLLVLLQLQVMIVKSSEIRSNFP